MTISAGDSSQTLVSLAAGGLALMHATQMGDSCTRAVETPLPGKAVNAAAAKDPSAQREGGEAAYGSEPRAKQEAEEVATCSTCSTKRQKH